MLQDLTREAGDDHEVESEFSWKTSQRLVEAYIDKRKTSGRLIEDKLKTK